MARQTGGEAEGVADFFHEIEEDLRRDQAMALWKKYGNLAIGAVLLVVLAVAGHWGWSKYADHQRLQASADFLSAAAAGDAAQREAALAQIAAEGGSYATLARFRLAEAALAAGDKAKARGILGEIADAAGTDPALAGLARIQAALLELEIGAPAKAAELVKDMTVAGHAYRLAALEVTGLAALAGGDRTKAKETFGELKKAAIETGSGSGFERRADQLLDRLKD
jgi:hypothetical protein